MWPEMVNSKKTDKSASGYENTLMNFNIGTEFEQYRDIYFAPDLSFTIDDLTVDSTASSQLKKQAGTFQDITFSYAIKADKRNRRYMPTDGHIFRFKQSLPVYADSKSMTNSFKYSAYHGFSENLVGAFKLYGAAVNGLGGEDVRLSKRLHLGRTLLRGFESGKVGPKDGSDYVGGNYVSAMNFEARLPNLLPENTQTDVAAFLDFGNLWSVDYDSSVGSSSKIRSSVGISANTFTTIGPLSFTLAHSLSKASNDETESFNFRLGTSF